MRNLNDRLANAASAVFASMWTAYAFAAFSLVPLVEPVLMSGILYASNCIQLVALPLLGVSGAVFSNLILKLLRETHDEVMQSHAELHSRLDRIESKLGVSA